MIHVYLNKKIIIYNKIDYIFNVDSVENCTSPYFYANYKLSPYAERFNEQVYIYKCSINKSLYRSHTSLVSLCINSFIPVKT